MNLLSLANSRLGTGLGLAFGRSIPTGFSYPLVNFLATKLASGQQLSLVRNVRGNQQLVHRKPLTADELQARVEEVFCHAGRCFVDLYRNFSRPQRLCRKIVINDDLERLIVLSQRQNFGAFVVVPHLSSFDLMLLAAARLGLKTKVLTFGRPTGGYRLQNEIRALSGLDIMPVSRKANLSALMALRRGGFVLTAVDRPVSGQLSQYDFFGRSVPLPDGHIRMALKAEVPVLVAAVHMTASGLYQLTLSDPLELPCQEGHLPETVRIQVERVLAILETYIRAHPTQWQMFCPLCPDLSCPAAVTSTNPEN